jgi:D-alanyl-D-alanine carboxypeptidase (penicillin-binding protein 5/6)
MLAKLLITISLLVNPLLLFTNQPPLLEKEDIYLFAGSAISVTQWANPNFLPIRDWGINEPKIEAESASIFMVKSLDPVSSVKTLYQENIDLVLPIASLTKLMTALIVVENVGLERVVIVSEKAIEGYGDKGGLVVDEQISVNNLLYALLMESSNDAAIALAEFVENESQVAFVELMNQKAQELGLTNTVFTDPSGYDSSNLSTGNDLAKLVVASFAHPIIWQILKTPSIDLSSADGTINHHWVSTDELLNRIPEIIGGKTGYTEEAQGCLILVIENSPSEYLITVILGAQERFLETEKLINWVKKAYKWEN